MNELLVYFGACIVTAMAFLSLLRWRFPRWSIRRTSALAALPVPVVSWILCAVAAIRVVGVPRDRCGVDACGMALGFSMIVAVLALVGFVMTWGLGAALLIARERRSR